MEQTDLLLKLERAHRGRRLEAPMEAESLIATMSANASSRIGLRGALRPVIDRTFPLTEVQAAHRYLESGSLSGKVVLCATEEVPC